MRAFTAFEIPEDVKKQISKIIEEKREKIRGIKWVEQENLHITCKFLGEVSEEKVKELERKLKEKLQSGKKIKITISGFGAFPNFKNPRVLWIGIEGEIEKLVEVWKVVEDVSRSLKIGEKEDKYTPHLTIGRIKQPIKLEPNWIDFPPREIEIKELTIFQSTLTPAGPIYKTLARIKI